MQITDIAVMAQFIQTCNDGWLQGWHERNGGNLTRLLTSDEVKELTPFFSTRPGSWTELGVTDTTLSGRYFLATGSGKYFRNVILNPEDSLAVVEINEQGNAFRVVWGLVNGGRPTSEFPTHYMNHCVRYRATDGRNAIIYHAHPANLIAMTYVLPLTDCAFSRALWKSATECPVVFPGGVGVVPWMVPGGAAIALASCEKMKEFEAVVWAQHGLFVAGPDFDTAFGLMHTIEKAAQIWVLQKSTGLPGLQTIQDNNLLDIANDFGVNLRRDFLTDLK